MARRQSQRDNGASTRRNGLECDPPCAGRSRSIRSPCSRALQGNPVGEKNALGRSPERPQPSKRRKRHLRRMQLGISDLKLPRHPICGGLIPLIPPRNLARGSLRQIVAWWTGWQIGACPSDVSATVTPVTRTTNSRTRNAWRRVDPGGQALPCRSVRSTARAQASRRCSASCPDRWMPGRPARTASQSRVSRRWRRRFRWQSVRVGGRP